jgi:glycerol-3-phosphate dehydrogenase
MRKDLNALADQQFDVVIVGGGIFGACAVWDAVLRGLSVALVERADFCSGTSANSFKIVHGGIRYLQHADLIRLRSSCRERSALLRIAPHLVQPLPIAIPTYGHGKKGKAFLGAGMLLYDLLTLDRNRGINDPRRKIPWTAFLTRQEILELFPDLPQQGLTGGTVFYDGQMYNPTRLALSFIRSAAMAGAVIANYVEAMGFLRSADRIEGIETRDTLTGHAFSIRAKMVLNTAGPWAERLLYRAAGIRSQPMRTYSRDTCFVIARRLSRSHALAVLGRTYDPDAILSRPARHLFLVPWRNYTLVGVWHKVYHGDPDGITIIEQDLQPFIEEINFACPSLMLSVKDVLMWNAGLVPFGENEPGSEHLSYGKRSHLIDHKTVHGIDGLVTLIGIRYTTARGDAAKALDLITARLGIRAPRPQTENIPIYGGQIEDFEGYVKEITARQPFGLNNDVVHALTHNYGTACEEVLRYAYEDPSLADTLDNSTVLKAEVLNAIHNEMALKLSDVVFRRTDLATGGDPGEQVLRTCADITAKELGWNSDHMEKELHEVRARFPTFQTAI